MHSCSKCGKRLSGNMPAFFSLRELICENALCLLRHIEDEEKANDENPFVRFAKEDEDSFVRFWLMENKLYLFTINELEELGCLKSSEV